jgi:hypothetical protein
VRNGQLKKTGRRRREESGERREERTGIIEMLIAEVGQQTECVR